MTRWTRTSAVALAAALMASPAVSADAASDAAAEGGRIHEQQDTQGKFDQPYVPGYNQSPEAEVSPKGAATIDSEPQQANRLDDEPALPQDKAGWDNHDSYTQAADKTVSFWREKVEALDPETVRLDKVRDDLSDLEDSQAKLEDADSGSWQDHRDAFDKNLMTLREAYAELPQGRKSQAATREPGEGTQQSPSSTAPSSTD